MNTHYLNIKHARGFTLVELMVTLVITSLLVLGAGGFLAASHKSNSVQTAVSGLNANGRFALNQISRDVRLAGYRDSDWQLGGITQPINAFTLTDGSSEGSDQLTLRYEDDRDCAYAPPVAGSGGIVVNDYIVDSNTNTLMCNNQVVASGVESMRVYYGRDTDNDGVPNRWVRPISFGGGGDVSDVVALRVHLLTVTNGAKLSEEAQSYYFDNQMRQAEDDGQIRREYSTTIATRNQF